ncbi:hypothetical protein [Nocardioides marmoriginsengisoli]|uniref:hypothetical protein n=1 Tax=Nocardioides marmoriginsengisoli TaxID=661483 RepID=UPI0011CD66E2|nr:hypothetical protein [Nocardioides marmoriginsengisoli]
MKRFLVALVMALGCVVCSDVASYASYEDDPCSALSPGYVSTPAEPPAGWVVPPGVVWADMPDCVYPVLSVVQLDNPAAAGSGETPEAGPLELSTDDRALLLAGLGLLVALSAARLVSGWSRG